MNQRVAIFLLNRYSKGQAVCHEITSKKKLPSQLSWFNPNKLSRLQFDIITAYQNSTRRSILGSFPIYKVERMMMVVLYKLAESLSFVSAKRYQNSTNAQILFS
jgi:hypothetical protein